MGSEVKYHDDVVYLDDNHLTDYGAHLASDVLAAAIDAAYARIAKATARAQTHAFVGPTLPRR